MRTDDLVAILSRGEGATVRTDDGLRLTIGVAVVLPFLILVIALAEGLLPPGLWPASATLWKLGYAGALATGGLWLFRRAGRPGASLALPILALVLVLVAAGAVGVTDFLSVPPEARLLRVMGKTALICTFSILGLSLPVLAVTLRVGRDLAPVRPGLAGLAAGLVAGAFGAVAFGLGCTEGSLTFVAIWYSAGIILAGLVGWLIGSRLLRW